MDHPEQSRTELGQPLPSPHSIDANQLEHLYSVPATVDGSVVEESNSNTNRQAREMLEQTLETRKFVVQIGVHELMLA